MQKEMGYRWGRLREGGTCVHRQATLRLRSQHAWMDPHRELITGWFSDCWYCLSHPHTLTPTHTKTYICISLKTQMLTYIYGTLKGVPQKENAVVIYSPFHSKLVWLSFFLWHTKEDILRNRVKTTLDPQIKEKKDVLKYLLLCSAHKHE